MGITSNTNNETNAKDSVYFDNLIIDCAYQRPLMMMSNDYEPDQENSFVQHSIQNPKGLKIEDLGCDQFHPILTSNGLCHSFNGVGPENIYSNAKIVQAFISLFGSIDKQSKKFRGTGHSEGKF